MEQERLNQFIEDIKNMSEEDILQILPAITDKLPKSETPKKPFDFIRKYDPSHVLNLILYEHPQTIAVILSYLEPNKASILLQNLPSEVQSDVSRRIACMDRCNANVINKLEKIIEEKLSNYSEQYASGGVEALVEILNLVDRASEKQIIEALEDEDPELAEEVKKRMFVFEDIIMLDDRSIQKVMREVDSQELAKALKSVDAEVQDKIFSNMSKRAAEMLKEDMDYMGPVRLVDVEHAQQKIVDIIRHLEDTGEIIVARAGGDELVIGVNNSGSGSDLNKKTRGEISFEALQFESSDKKNNVFKYIISKANPLTLKAALSMCGSAIYKAFLKQMNFFERIKFNRLKCIDNNSHITELSQREIGRLFEEWQNEVCRQDKYKDDDSGDDGNIKNEVLKA